MRKILLLLMALLTLSGSRAWATDVLPTAVVGTYAFQAQALTTGASDYNISKKGDNDVIISAKNGDNLGTYTVNGGKNYLTCTLVVKINVPSTPSPGILCQMRKADDNTSAAQGLYLTSDRKLKTSWETGTGRQTDANAPDLAAGEHTIIYTAGPELTGAKVYIDGTTADITDGGLRGGDAEYKVIYIPAAYAQYITEVHFFNSVQNTDNISSIVTECSNHMHASQQSDPSVTVPSGKTLVIDADDNLSKYSFGGDVNIAVASGKTLTLDQDNSSITTLSGSGTALQSTDITTTVAGNLSDLTLKATAGTLKYTGKTDAEPTLNGTTLYGVTLAGSNRIKATGNITIENLAGNDQSTATNTYAFYTNTNVSVTLKGNCDFTKKSDGTDATAQYIGVNSGGTLTIADNANVKVKNLYNSTTVANNANITIGSGATLESTGSCYSPNVTNNGTFTMGGALTTNGLTLNEGSTINIGGSNLNGLTTVSGDATLNATADLTLSQAITIAASKTLTIDGGSNAVNLNVVPTFGDGSTINFENATINYPNNIRNLANYTFTSSTAKFIETTDEYKAGGFTITNIASGVTIKVKKYGATDYETVTPSDGTATISHSVGVSGLAAWLDYTFNESTKETNTQNPSSNKITNAGNAGTTGHELTIDGSYTAATSYNDDGTLKVMSTPWRDITWPTNYTVAVAGNVPDVENGCLVAFGSVNGTGHYLAIIRGASQNEIKLVKGHQMNNAFEEISTMSAANATALSHLVVFTKQGDSFDVYLDGVNVAHTTYSETLGGGFQIGSIHGGVTGTGVVRVANMDAAIKEAVFAKAIRVYDYVISEDQMEQLKEEFPYVSYGGKYSRTISGNSNLSATDAWLNNGTQGYVDVPVNATVDAVTYYPDVEITTTAASTLTVNADMDAGNIEFKGAGKLTIASDGAHNIKIYSSVSAKGAVSVNYDQIDLTAVPVTIGESGSIEFDFSDHDFSSVLTSTDYPVTGNTSDYGDKVTGVYPVDEDHSYTLTYNGTTNRYYLTVAPTLALKQKLAIALVTPYYNDSYVGSGLGKYTISLGETSYTTLSDFETAVDLWETLGDYVEPTIVLNMPTNGFYRFTSQNNSDQKGNAGKYLHNYLTDGAIALNSTEDKTTIFYVDCTNNTLLSYDNGLYLNNYNVEPSIGNSYSWTIEEGTEVGKYALKMGSTWYASDWNTTEKITYGEKDANALWAIESVEEIPVTITSAGYATLSAPVALTVAGGVTAYYISNVTSTTATLTDIGSTIPANTPVVLKGAEGDYEFDITTADEFVGSNLLEKTIAAVSYTEGDYTLQINDGYVGFYDKVPTNNVIPGFKAYLPSASVPAGVKGFTFIFDGADGITTVQTETGNSEMYNLAGQRVEKAQKGIYIQNGKKVLIK